MALLSIIGGLVLIALLVAGVAWLADFLRSRSSTPTDPTKKD